MSKKEVTNEKLATMIKAGFDHVTEGIHTLRSEVSDVKSEVGHSHSDIAELKQGQEDIRLRFMNVPYRFKLEDLTKRVDRLERKTGIDHS